MNAFLISVFFAWFLAQVVGKIIAASIVRRKFYLRAALFQAGMPSAHAALVSAVSVATGFDQGFY